MSTAITIEIWVELAIGTSIFFLRFFTRWKRGGLQNFAADDAFALLAMISWIVRSVTFNLSDTYGSFVGLNVQKAASVSDEAVGRLRIGSKLVFVGWITYTTAIWALKASLLCFYWTLTKRLYEAKMIIWMTVACITSYIVIIIMIITRCLPVQRNWQIKPYAGDNCTEPLNSYIVTGVFNILTDIGMLFIILRILSVLRLPLGRLIFTSFLLGSGIFVAVCALIRVILVVYNLGNHAKRGIWGGRELLVAIIVVNLPVIKPLFNKTSWFSKPPSNADLSSPSRV